MTVHYIYMYYCVDYLRTLLIIMCSLLYGFFWTLIRHTHELNCYNYLITDMLYMYIQVGTHKHTFLSPHTHPSVCERGGFAVNILHCHGHNEQSPVFSPHMLVGYKRYILGHTTLLSMIVRVLKYRDFLNKKSDFLFPDSLIFLLYIFFTNVFGFIAVVFLAKLN